MSQIDFRQVQDRLNRQQAALARLVCCTPDEAAQAAVALIQALFEYQVVVLLQHDPYVQRRLFASSGISAEQQTRWQRLDQRQQDFWQQLQLPACLELTRQSAEHAQLLTSLGLHDLALAVALPTSAPAGLSLLVVAQPRAAVDSALDLAVLELLSLQIATALNASAALQHQRAGDAIRSQAQVSGGAPVDQLEAGQDDRAQTVRRLVLERQLFEQLATGAALPDVLRPLVELLELHCPDDLGAALICDDTWLIQRQRASMVQPATYSYTIAAGLQGPITREGDLEPDEHGLLSVDLADPRWAIYRQSAPALDRPAGWLLPFHDQAGKLLGVLALYLRAQRRATEAEQRGLAEVALLAARVVERLRDDVVLRDREELFRLISENTTDHIGVLDDEGKYLYASPSLRASLGYDPAELVGVSAFAHVHPDDLAVTLATWNKVDSQGLVQSTFRYRTTHGTWRWFDAIGNQVSYRGARAFISVSRDITERRQAEQARQKLEAQLAQAQKMESIGTLAGGIAHDFNNILTAILGNVQLALLGLTPQSPEYPLLEEIEKAATRASTLTRQLLTFSRYQQHERKAVDLNATISELLQMFRRLISGSVEIVIELAADLPLLVADPVQIEQVVLNLAVNARDAMPDGGQLLIATRTCVLDAADCRDYPWTRPGLYAQIMVCDTGLGMDEETQQRIFEPFFTTKEPGKGTGLGLAVVYGIIKQYGGFITVSSTVDKGSTFSVFLPAQASVSMPSEPLSLPHVRGGSETILVVEDEAALRQLATTTLERLGYRVLCAEDGLAAVELFNANPALIDLVILDLIMPRLGGREALTRMRELRPDLPAFFVTGYDSSVERSAALSTVASAPILSKPYRLDTLGLTVRQLLDS